jgi:hypothetical protein
MRLLWAYPFNQVVYPRSYLLQVFGLRRRARLFLGVAVALDVSRDISSRWKNPCCPGQLSVEINTLCEFTRFLAAFRLSRAGRLCSQH